MPIPPCFFRLIRLHLLGALLPRLPSIALLLASHTLCRQAKLLLPHTRGKMACSLLIDSDLSLSSIALRVVLLSSNQVISGVVPLNEVLSQIELSHYLLQLVHLILDERLMLLESYSVFPAEYSKS